MEPGHLGHARAQHSQFGVLSLVRRLLAGQDLQALETAEHLVYAGLDFIFYYCTKDKKG